MSTILVADAEPQLRRILARLLEADGHVCAFAGDGEDALRMAREGRPDLVLIDVEMPRRSGLEVLAALRQDEVTRATPVIVTCAGAWLAAVDAQLIATADGLVEKPFDADQLVTRVRGVLRRARSRADRSSGSPWIGTNAP